MKRSNSTLSSQIYLLVERATNTTLAQADPALTISIAQYAQSSEDGPKEVARAIRKRTAAVTNARDFVAARHCLDLLEACVQRCGHRFHLQVGARRDLLDELLRLMGPKYSPPAALQERVLHLLVAWSDQFKDRPELKEVDRVLRELRAKGVPLPDASATYETLTYANVEGLDGGGGGAHSLPSPQPQPQPQPQAPPMPSADLARRAQSMPQPPQPQPTLSPGGRGRPSSQPPAAGASLTPHQLGKLRQDVGQVCANCRVFNELLTELGRGAGAATAADASDDVVLLRQLNAANRQMQRRLMELLGQVTDESVLNELLHVNDDLNSAFLRYDRFENSRPQSQSLPQPQLLATTAAATAAAANADSSSNLIDFSEPDAVRGQQRSAPAVPPTVSNLPDTEDELREMEHWMLTEGMTSAAGGGGGGGGGGTASSSSSAVGRQERFEL